MTEKTGRRCVVGVTKKFFLLILEYEKVNFEKLLKWKGVSGSTKDGYGYWNRGKKGNE